jgi:D-lactate dehydrogenase (cytochrome)
MHAATPIHPPEPVRRAGPLPEALLQALQARFAAQFSTALALREQHGRDESAFSVAPPDAVLFAHSTQDVSDALRLCAQFKTPVIPFGVGSSLEGHVLAVQGGDCVSRLGPPFLDARSSSTRHHRPCHRCGGG